MKHHKIIHILIECFAYLMFARLKSKIKGKTPQNDLFCPERHYKITSKYVVLVGSLHQ